MLKIENVEVTGWEHAIRGMRNPKNSWEKSDSRYHNDPIYDEENPLLIHDNPIFNVGPNDQKLMMTLRNAGTDHRKFMRMITVYLDITAPLYWWKEFDTYKVGTVANSCSTMHKIHAKEFTLEDFSCEHVLRDNSVTVNYVENDFRILNNLQWLMLTIDLLNAMREAYLKTKDKVFWWQMIQLLPSSYNQKRTVMCNYEVLANMYKSRKNHKLDEWKQLCGWMETLPYSELITGVTGEYVIPSADQIDKLFAQLAEIDPRLTSDYVVWERCYDNPALIRIFNRETHMILYAFDFDKCKPKDAIEFAKTSVAGNLKAYSQFAGTLRSTDEGNDSEEWQ